MLCFGYLTSIFLLPVNLYGPNDNFDPQSSHVIPALIRKCLETRASGASEIVLWGDGTPTREFLYVTDAVRAIVLATGAYDRPEPVNLGSGQEISIRDLRSAHCAADRLRGNNPLGHVQTQWPAATVLGRHPRRAAIRLPGHHTTGEGLGTDDSLVPGVSGTTATG